MEQVNQVIILGAGASKSEGAPLQNELFKEFFKRYSEQKHAKPVLDFFLHFWGIDFTKGDITESSLPSFEECLGILDWAVLRSETLKGYTHERINKVRSNLVFLIAKVLEENLRGRTIHHKNLVKRLMNEGLLSKTCFISLNYDTIIDSALAELYPTLFLDYGIEFSNSFEIPDNESLNNGNPILLLKIHGSLNWLYCSTCSQMRITAGERQIIKAFYREENCNTCGMPSSPVIVPPTLYKELSNPFIQKIFLKTDTLLRQAEKVFICGYSFGDSDMHIKYLLKRAELFRGNTPDIHVINFHKGKKRKQGELEKQRFLRFFKNKPKVFYHQYTSFEEFAVKGIQ